jgi:coenzyme F420-reducing hydrogenase beta subunit
MPKVFEQDGYRFFFYRTSTGPSMFTSATEAGRLFSKIESAVQLRESQGLKVRELAKAEELATEHRGLILQMWHEHFNR